MKPTQTHAKHTHTRRQTHTHTNTLYIFWPLIILCFLWYMRHRSFCLLYIILLFLFLFNLFYQTFFSWFLTIFGCSYIIFSVTQENQSPLNLYTNYIKKKTKQNNQQNHILYIYIFAYADDYELHLYVIKKKKTEKTKRKKWKCYNL